MFYITVYFNSKSNHIIYSDKVDTKGLIKALRIAKAFGNHVNVRLV